MMGSKIALSVCALSTVVFNASMVQAGPILDSVRATKVSMAQCLDVTAQTIAGQATHLEFESRDGMPIYEFVVAGDDGVIYYIACSGESGVIQDVDIIVEPGDQRFARKAQVDEAAARGTATEQYPGEIEEVKHILTTHGEALYEVDVELAKPQTGLGTATAELNVWVNAQTGELHRVDVEYWEIGESGEEIEPAAGEESNQ